MRKRAVLMAAIMTFALAASPAAAHQNFSDGTDFEGFVSNYDKDNDGTFLTNGDVLFKTSDGQFRSWSNQTAQNGVLSEGPAVNARGKALKICQSKSGTREYGGVAYFPNTKLYNTVYIETSFYAEQAVPRLIRLRGSAGSSVIPAVYLRADNVIESVFGASTGSKRYELNKWYDIKIWYNQNTKEYKVLITSEGSDVVNQSGTYTGSVNLSYIDRIELFNSITCEKLTGDAVCYWDNFKAESAYKYTGKTRVTDSFESFVSSDTTEAPPKPSGALYSYYVENSVSGKDGVTADNTAGKGTSLKIVSETKTTTGIHAIFGNPGQTDKFIPAFDMSVSVKIPDLSQARCAYLTLGDASNSQLCIFQFAKNRVIEMWGKSAAEYEPGKWYDINVTFDGTSGIGTYEISDESGEYSVSGEVDVNETQAKAIKTALPQAVRRVIFRQMNKANAEGVLDPAYFWIDDFSIVSIIHDNSEVFETDIEESTTGAEKIVKINDDVKVKFKNKLAEAETSDALLNKFTLNFGEGSITSVERLDDYTLKINFDKKKGRHYHVAFENISDIYGNTLSDYIEFDTEPVNASGSIEITDGDGAKIDYIKKGTVNVNANYYSPSGAESNGIFSAVLYDESGKIIDMYVRYIKFGVESATENAAFSIPNNDKAYKIKAFLWTENLEPVASNNVSSRIAILKLDDLRDTNYEKFLTLKDWAEENKVKMGFGVICNTLEKENEDYYNALKAMDDSEYVEIWCHGYTHFQTGDSESGYNTEFTAPLSEQTETLRKCADILYDKCGITLRSLGVPHNLKNEDTAKALEAVPQFKTLIASGSPISGKTFLHLTNLIKFESGTGVIAPLDDIKDYLSKCGSYEYIMFQGHAPYWNENNRDDFATVVQLLEYLKGEDIKFFTPTEYYNFVN